MITITDFDERLGLTRYDADNWRRRVGLFTQYKPTTAGKAQEYSRENVLELAATAAFVKSGMPPKSAIAYANAMIRNIKADVLQDWLVFPAGDFSSGVATNEPTPDLFHRMVEKSPASAVVVIGQKAIVARVNALFAELSGA